MATINEIAFEMERRNIIFHKNTSMPDETQLGYEGDPNNAVLNNTPGESLLCNCPSGSLYLDKSVAPHKMYYKVEDRSGGI
jgi:hypothetical protein